MVMPVTFDGTLIKNNLKNVKDASGKVIKTRAVKQVKIFQLPDEGHQRAYILATRNVCNQLVAEYHGKLAEGN